jgi:BolA family transcriptional regulator, general stress-responsive regulator
MISRQAPHKPICAVHRLSPFHKQMRRQLMNLETRMREKLMVGLRPSRLDLVNESHLSAGHHSSPGTDESHFRVLIVSEVFAGKSRVERHRVVNELLSDELKGGVHALAIKACAPGEAAH